MISIYPYIFGLILLYGFWRLYKYVDFKRRIRLPFPPEWEAYLHNNLPPYAHLTEIQQSALKKKVQIFLNKKQFEGCGGQEITEEIKVTIAAQACLLILNHTSSIYPKLRTILVYPSAYRPSGEGLFHKEDVNSVRLGESWAAGVVVLSWDSVIGGARNFEDGKNVTLHEFAHQLDQEDGRGDGAPVLSDRSAYVTWAQTFSEEFLALQNKTSRGRKSVMDAYGATNPAEFFAVATETFFEKPDQMQRNHPELFQELLDYYQLDPRSFD